MEPKLYDVVELVKTGPNIVDCEEKQIIASKVSLEEAKLIQLNGTNKGLDYWYREHIPST